MPKEATRVRMNEEQLRLVLNILITHEVDFPVSNILYSEYADIVYRLQTALAKVNLYSEDPFARQKREQVRAYHPTHLKPVPIERIGPPIEASARTDEDERRIAEFHRKREEEKEAQRLGLAKPPVTGSGIGPPLNDPPKPPLTEEEKEVFKKLAQERMAAFHAEREEKRLAALAEEELEEANRLAAIQRLTTAKNGDENHNADD